MLLVTWNMQGGSTVWIRGIQSLYMNSREKPVFDQDHQHAICCLQEVTAPPREAEIDRQTQSGAEVYKWTVQMRAVPSETLWVVYYQWTRVVDGGNRRCSLAVVSRAEPEDALALPSAGGTYRPGLAVIFQPVTVVSIHANAGGGNTTLNDSVDLLTNAVDFLLSHYRRPVVVAGDFNCNPDILQAHLNRYAEHFALSLRIWPPRNPTHQDGGRIDYVVASPNLRVDFQKDLGKTHGPWAKGGKNSDHIAQLFSIG